MKLCIGCYNIQHARHFGHYLETGEERRSIPEIAEIIRNEKMDICGLQEVFLNDHTKHWVEGTPRHQARGIAELLGFEHAFALAHDNAVHKDGGYGVAVVSRYHIVGKRTVSIPAPRPEERTGDRWYEDRVLQSVEIDINGKILTIINTHFGLNQDERDRALVLAEQELERIKTPILMMGDMNMGVQDRVYKRLTQILNDPVPDIAFPKLFPSNDPKYRGDFIFASKDLNVSNTRAVNTLVSDHLPFLLDVEW